MCDFTLYLDIWGLFCDFGRKMWCEAFHKNEFLGVVVKMLPGCVQISKKKICDVNYFFYIFCVFVYPCVSLLNVITAHVCVQVRMVPLKNMIFYLLFLFIYLFYFCICLCYIKIRVWKRRKPLFFFIQNSYSYLLFVSAILPATKTQKLRLLHKKHRKSIYWMFNNSCFAKQYKKRTGIFTTTITRRK